MGCAPCTADRRSFGDRSGIYPRNTVLCAGVSVAVWSRRCRHVGVVVLCLRQLRILCPRSHRSVADRRAVYLLKMGAGDHTVCQADRLVGSTEYIRMNENRSAREGAPSALRNRYAFLQEKNY